MVPDQRRLMSGGEGTRDGVNDQRRQRQGRGFNPTGERQRHGHQGETYGIHHREGQGEGGDTDAYIPISTL